jgi:beta-phosphoglucomutase family hydrolase
MTTQTQLRRDAFDALILDMDGVITDTARVHTAAWTELFDDYLASEAPAEADTRAFSLEDYHRYVDGRARIDGVETFLASRGIELPRGHEDDTPGSATAWALANRKNDLFHAALEAEGVDVFGSTVRLTRAARHAGWRTAVVTASRNRADVLDTAGISDLFDTAVDGIDAAELGLPGKPDPATFLEAARRLAVDPARAVLVEDARSGVAAGKAGSFGLVIGVDRVGQASELAEAGADVVVGDLAEIELSDDGEGAS